MAELEVVNDLSGVQSAVDRLVSVPQDQLQSAFEELSQAVLEHFGETYDSTAANKLLSRDLPLPIRSFAAAWLVRCLTRSSSSLRFGYTERLAAGLFDQVFRHSIYQRANIDPRRQTFEKLQELEGHLHSVLIDSEALVSVPPNLGQLNSFLQRLLGFLNNKANQPFLTHFLPASLLHQARIANLSQVVTDYAENADGDPIHRRDSAIEACEDFEREAREFGTADAERILGGLARQLKSAVEDHFESSEASKSALLEFAPISKKYPLERVEATISFRIKVANSGGPHHQDSGEAKIRESTGGSVS